jgi:transcriptional regulator with XRE-family HTH domain
MNFSDYATRRLVSRALGAELRRVREERDMSRAQLVELLPSGIGERTVLAYEHGAREMSVTRLLELCATLEAEPTSLVRMTLQRVEVGLDNLVLHVDVRALLHDPKPLYRPMVKWARNKLKRHPDGIVDVEPAAVRELADLVGCSHNDLATHLARFLPGE